MFSGSNSYLGGGASGRPSQSPFGQQQQQQQQFAQPAQQYGQQFGQQPLQQQYTGFPAGALQSQATGFPPQQQPQQYGQQQQFTGFQQPQPTGFQQSQPQQQSFKAAQPTGLPPPPPVQISQPTGMNSNDMANSFRSTLSQPPPPAAPAPTTGTKIPNVRLSFITAEDQAKFEQLFKSATSGEQALTGDKAKDLLLRSKLDGDSLAQIWTLSDTTKSGQLLFPEFALAMYLCNLKLTGKAVPSSLPERIRNEVSSMVDIISFGVVDDAPARVSSSNAPNFGAPPQIQAPQAQNPTNQQLLSQLTAQPTGFQVPQATGFQQQQGLQPQATGFPGGMPQAQGYTGPRPPMPPMPTGMGQNQQGLSPNYGLSPQPTGFGGGPMAQPLNAQPTGRPGQWGLVNAPASGLPNLQALQSQMMPQPGREAGFSAQGLRGNATVPWAVTKDEKKIYDEMFKAWDGFGKGYITGNQAIEIFGQSGLEKAELERIWTLSDPHNKGRLNLDEFAVAMHLIYRRLNGYPVPNQLPAELIPPSTRNIDSSIGTMKNLLSQDAQSRKSTGAFLQPQRTGVSYLKSHSLRANGAPDNSRKDATVFKNNDDDVGYRSSARRRVGDRGRSSSPALSDTSSATADEMSVDQLKKTIREKQVLLDAMDFEDESKADEEDALDRKDRKESEDLFRRLRTIQENIDSHPNSAFKTADSDAERRTLQRQLRSMQDRLPELASHVRKCERAIADAQLELFRLKDAKAHPGSAAAIVGTGPGGAVTESDRLKARAKAMMQQRSAALTGKKVDTGDDGSAAAQRLEGEQKRVTREREDNEKMVRDVEESVTEYSKGLESSLKEGGESAANEHERRRWEEGLGVEDEVKDFIFDLQRSSRSARIRHEEKAQPRPAVQDDNNRTSSPVSRTDSPASSKPAASTPQTTGSSYSSYRTAEERAAFIKQQAEQRMAERLAALGIKAPSKGAETATQRLERERKEREEKLRQAEEEDAKREQERQARLQGESVAPPSPAAPAGKPKPPPPRKNRSESLQSNEQAQAQAEQKRAEQQIKEQALKEQEVAIAQETREMEDEEARQERELRQQREEAEASLRVLEEQVRAGKVKKAEEKRRREAAKKEAAEKETRLAAQRAEIETAKEKERQLRLQLESLGDEDSSDDDDEGAQRMTPTESTPTQSMELPQITEPPEAPPVPAIASPPPPPPMPETASPAAPSVTSPPSESKNPFYRSMGQSSSAGTPSAESSEKKVDTNPFHRLTQQDLAKQQALPDPAAPPARKTAKPADEDDWSVMDSSDDEDEDDDGKPQGGSAKQLASILFGTMAPPRPASAFESPTTASGPGSPVPPKDRVASPPPAPPLPSNGAPPPPPLPGSAAPPPPPLPTGGAPPPPPGPPPPPSSNGSNTPAAAAGDRSGLLQQIQLGRGLKKVQTKDRSQASTAGRVL